MRLKMNVLLASVMLITGCHSSEQPVGQPDDLTDSAEAEYSPVDISEMPDGFEEFLGEFAYAVDRTFAYLNPSREYEFDVTEGHETWIVPFILPIMDFSRYAVNIKYEGTTAYIDEEEMDWVLTNIFNFSAEALDKLKHDSSFSDTYHDGIYEFMLGAGANTGITNISAAFNGKYYYVVYETGYWAFDPETAVPTLTIPDPSVSKHYALLEYKVIDGTGYWSIYKDTADSDAIDAPGIN